jgi:hypothetical protein
MGTRLRLIRAYFRIKRQSDVPKGIYRDEQGRVCAVGALYYPRSYKRPPSVAASLAKLQLEDEAIKLFGYPAGYVNDTQGRGAVLRIYRHAIVKRRLVSV